MSDDPTVTITLPYERALRLSFMARYPATVRAGDGVIADAVDEAIEVVERSMADDARPRSEAAQ